MFGGQELHADAVQHPRLRHAHPGPPQPQPGDLHEHQASHGGLKTRSPPGVPREPRRAPSEPGGPGPGAPVPGLHGGGLPGPAALLQRLSRQETAAPSNGEGHQVRIRSRASLV